MRNVVIILAVFTFAVSSPAQQSAIFGGVRIAGGRPLPDAEILVQSETTGSRWKLVADDTGSYSTPPIPPGRYKVTVRLAGFRTVTRTGVVLESNRGEPLDFELEFLTLHQMITVVSGRDELDPTGGDSLHLTRQGPGYNLPTNGRDFRATFDLVPGVATVPAAVSDAGQFTANGQRPNANTFRVDGVSANTGVGGTGMPGSFPGASLPAMSGLGGTENLVSPEGTAEVVLHTSNFAPEFGERLGAESFVTTRSGSNQFHGSAFGHYRDRHGTAPDWFANSRGLDFPRPFYNTLGGVIGGPLWRNRAFFFGSGETSYVRDSGVQMTSVPSQKARNTADPQLASLLGAFPPPTGRDFGDGQAEAVIPLGRTGRVQSYSARFDVPLGSHGSLFTRLSYAPSKLPTAFTILSQDYLSASQGLSGWFGVTGGFVSSGKNNILHDVRFNYSHSSFTVRGVLGSWQYAFYLGGITSEFGKSTEGLLPTTGYSTFVFGISIPGLGQFTSNWFGSSRQDQWELRDTVAVQRGRHQFRAGADAFRFVPSRVGVIRYATAFVSSLDALIVGAPMPMSYSTIPADHGNSYVVSTFAQDTFHIGDALNLMYGLRWEFTPPISGPLQTDALSGVWAGNTWQSVHRDSNGAAPWNMSYGQIAPRVGLAWRLPVAALVLRAGAGVFFDTRLGAAVSPTNGGPFNSWQLSSGLSGITIPGNPNSMAGIPGGSADSPDVQQFLNGEAPGLRLPRSYQWRASLDRELGPRGIASMAYIGTAGRHLLGNRTYLEPDTGVLRRRLTLSENSSIYHALQLSFTGALVRRLYASSSYTWSHSIDNGSLDSATILVYPGYNPNFARASSSFDVRHTWTSSLSYSLAGIILSGIFRARTGFPIDVVNEEQAFGRRFDNAGRPDLVPGQPVWFADPNAGGGRRLNPTAFSDPAPGLAGNLGRNALTGFGLTQLDLSVRRAFRLPWHMSIQLGVNVYNVLNHPSFADPVRYRSSHWFGQSTSMQNVMLGLGTPNGGIPSLFQTGGARAAEASVHLSF